jgi:hypothetical protein
MPSVAAVEVRRRIECVRNDGSLSTKLPGDKVEIWPAAEEERRMGPKKCLPIPQGASISYRFYLHAAINLFG